MNEISIRKLQLALFLVSISIIAFQLALIQIISFVQWYHFAYMIISVAMLGFGTAGTILSLFKEKLLKNLNKLLPTLVILSGLMMPAVVYISQIDFIRFDMMLLFTGNLQISLLIINYVLFTIPFFLSALAIGLIFTKYTNIIGKLYFSNLIGSGLGGIIILLLFHILFPEKLTITIGLLATTAGIILIARFDKHLVFLTVSALIFFLLSYFWNFDLQPSEFKSRSKALNLQDAKIIDRQNSPFGITELITSPMIRNANGLSLTFIDEIKPGTAVFVGGDFEGTAIENCSLNSDCFLDYTTSQLPFIISERRKVLILNSGSGVDIQRALRAGAKKIVAVEPNNTLLKLFTANYPNLNDSAYLKNEVSIINLSARSFLLSNKEKFDLIILPTIDAFGGSSGLLSLREQYHLTLQAFNNMLEQLNDNGVLMINIWLDYPPRGTLKIISTIVEVLESNGLTIPLEHIASIKNWNHLTTIVKKTPLILSELTAIRNFCGEMQFDHVLLPRLNSDELDRFNKLQDDSFYQLLDKILKSKSDRQQLYDDYAFNISPATDDKPFFFQFMKLSSMNELALSYNRHNIPFLELGYVILYLTLAQIFFISVLFIIIPLFKLGLSPIRKVAVLLYFAGIGIGYMFAEIIFIQMFTLYFGSPIYSAAIIICIMLLSSGAGSYFTYKYPLINKKLLWIIIFIVLSLTIQAIFLKEIIYSTIHYSVVKKWLISFLVIFPCAFAMGMPFPTALKKVNEASASVTPWAWGINGFASVIATVLSTLIAVEFGFKIVFYSAALFYTLSLLLVKKFN